MALPTLVGQSHTASDAADSISWPSGHATDDVAILLVEAPRDSSSEYANITSAGWTEITGARPVAEGAGADESALYAWWKRATSGAEAAVSLDDGGDHEIASMYVWRNARSFGSPVSQASTAVNGSASATVSLPAKTLTSSDCLAIYAIACNTNAAATSVWGSATAATISTDGLTATHVTASTGWAVTTDAFVDGDYVEFNIDNYGGAAGRIAVGYFDGGDTLDATLRTYAYRSDGNLYTAGSSTGSAGTGTYTTSDRIMICRKGGKIWFGKNGTWNGDPSAGTGEYASGLGTGSLRVWFDNVDTGAATTLNWFWAYINYTPPTGCVPHESRFASISDGGDISLVNEGINGSNFGTDSAIGLVRSTAVGTASGTSSTTMPASAKTVVLAFELLSELIVGTAYETDTALLLPDTLLETITETDTAAAIASARAATVGTTSETDSAGVFTPQRFYPFETAYEAGYGNVVGPARVVDATDSFTVGDAILEYLGTVVHESLALAEAYTPSLVFDKVVLEPLLVTALVRKADVAALAETLTLDQALTAQLSIAIREALALTEVVAPGLVAYLSLTDNLSLADTLGKVVAELIAETLNVSDAVAYTPLLAATVSEILQLTATESAQLVVRIEVDEALDLTDAELVQQILNGTIEETIQFVFVSQTGDYTAWAVNTRTGAVSQYLNYSFNSFVEIYPHYIGASEDGLFQLDGDDDDGTEIYAKLRPALAQFSSTYLSSTDKAYVAMRGDGAFIFRVITGDGTEHSYTFNASSMHTSRVDLGRGIKARYIAFELESAGQDFDLDSVEILPLQMNRRVSE